jgi:hypothetical protein
MSPGRHLNDRRRCRTALVNAVSQAIDRHTRRVAEQFGLAEAQAMRAVD